MTIHSDTSQLAKDLMVHYQHDVEVAQYTDGTHDPANVSLECLDCGTVIYTEDITPDEPAGVPVSVEITPRGQRMIDRQFEEEA